MVTKMSAQYDLEPLRDAAARLVAARVTVQAWTETVAHHTREAYTAGVREAELQRVTGLARGTIRTMIGKKP